MEEQRTRVLPACGDGWCKQGGFLVEYYSCDMIELRFLTFNGRIDTSKDPISLCCECFEDIPRFSLAQTPEETVKNFLEGRELLVAQSKAYSSLPPSAWGEAAKLTSGCQKCFHYQKKEWKSDGLTHYINLSMYPAPCQCRCIYCNVRQEDKSNEKTAQAYENLFAAIQLAKELGLIAPDAIWQVSSGEITIHPYKKRILDLVRGQATRFFTNCFKYDEEIAQNLHDNPKSEINLSIDAGTPQTWHKVKGANNFEKVMENLTKYYQSSVRDGQITLKYIVLPGINDTWEDYSSLMEIMRVLKVPYLEVSRDTSSMYTLRPEERTTLASATAYLVALCKKNGVARRQYYFLPEEQRYIEKLADEILQQGLLPD